jgi:hypothetical protein
MISWGVLMRPVDDEADGEVVRGVSVYLSDGEGNEWETGRVAFLREQSVNPAVPFEDKLLDVMDRAQQAADVMNDALDDFDRRKAQERIKWQDKIREILGDSAGVV